MAKYKPGKIQDLNGIFIYHDEKYGTIFYDFITKRAFKLSSSDLQYCLYYTALLPAAVVISLSLISFLEIKLSIALSVGIVAYVLAEILFRVLYFYKLPVIKNFKRIKSNESFLIRFAKKYSAPRLIVLSILMVLIAVFTVLYGIENNSVKYAIIVGYILAIMCLIVAILSLIALGIRKKNNY